MRLIDADALASRLKIIFCKECKEAFGCVSCSVGDYFEEIKDAPTIDVVPVVHGHWEDPEPEGCISFNKKAYSQCSVCKQKANYGWSYKHCPNCGAKMDEASK